MKKKYFGINLKKIREQKNISGEKFAEFLDITPAELSEIELGTYPIDIDVMENIKYLFDLDDAEDLMTSDFSISQIENSLLFNDEINENDIETVKIINELAENIKFMSKC